MTLTRCWGGVSRQTRKPRAAASRARARSSPVAFGTCAQHFFGGRVSYFDRRLTVVDPLAVDEQADARILRLHLALIALKTCVDLEQLSVRAP